jgi:F0F1-type ATP synthase membrane subunit c/vacuolar-type H+-ATPase subunit K
MAIRTIFDVFWAGVSKTTATLIAYKIQRAIAEQAVKAAALRRGVAGKILTCAIVIEFVTVFNNHGSLLFTKYAGEYFRKLIL